jgi:hypothetical protein
MTLTLKGLRRQPFTVRMPIDKIKREPFESDPEFSAHYTCTVRGEAPVGLTRVTTERIQVGFIRPGDTAPTISPAIPDEHVLTFRKEIRCGRRPALWVYRPKGPCTRNLVCSDDVAALMAYRVEGFKTVPVCLMNPSIEDLEESALLFRYLPSMPSLTSVFEGSLVPKSGFAVAILGNATSAMPLSKAFGVLYAAASHRLKLLRRFNMKTTGSKRVHYHESMASALVRSARLISGARQMCAHGMPELAALPIRALYELSLSVYLDWLAPEVVGSYFNDYALVSHRGTRNEVIRSVAAERRKTGWSDSAAQTWAKAQERMFTLVESPHQRAMVSPLAEAHDRIYPALCHEAHQDFVAGSRFLGALDTMAEPSSVVAPRIGGSNRTLLRVADLSVGSICMCADTDLGSRPGLESGGMLPNKPLKRTVGRRRPPAA